MAGLLAQSFDRGIEVEALSLLGKPGRAIGGGVECGFGFPQLL